MKYQFIPENKYFITYSIDRKHAPPFNDIIKEIIYKYFTDQVEVFAIINDHVHFIIDTTSNNDVKSFLNKFSGGSAFEINKYLNRRGKYWQKYHTTPIYSDSAYQKIVLYILGNPIRHGVVHSFDELYNYKYSSFKDYCNSTDRELVEQQILSNLEIKLNQDEDSFIQSLSTLPSKQD